MAFQSRVGREEWLRPYCDEVIAGLPNAGVRTLDVVCPGFAADCLETLEEIAMQNAGLFVHSGGTALRYVPALNASDDHVGALLQLIRRHGGGWPEFADPQTQAQAATETAAAQAAFRHFSESTGAP